MVTPRSVGGGVLESSSLFAVPTWFHQRSFLLLYCLIITNQTNLPSLKLFEFTLQSVFTQFENLSGLRLNFAFISANLSTNL